MFFSKYDNFLLYCYSSFQYESKGCFEGILKGKWYLYE